MESWETLLKIYPDNPKTHEVINAISKANYILDEDLADFEIDWFFESLLSHPIGLLDLIDRCVKSGDLLWCNVVENGLTLLIKVVKKYTTQINRFLPHIIEICKLRYTRSKKHAINCLTTIVQQSHADVGRVTDYIKNLRTASDCVRPYVLFIDALFEHRSECLTAVDAKIAIDNFLFFLNKFSDAKNSDIITRALIKGLCSILKHFSDDILTVKLTYLCSTVLGFLKKNRCEDECLYMLEHYAALFSDTLAGETELRAAMWASLGGQSGGEKVRAALVSIYRALIKDASPQDIELIKREVRSQGESLTTLKILRFIPGEPPHRETTHHLEHALAGVVPAELAEKISWLLECYPTEHTSLLEAVIENYENVRNKLNIVDIIMKLPQETGRGATTFLIIKSIDDIDKYMPLWQILFEYDDLTATRNLFNDYVNYFLRVLKADHDQQLPEWVWNLLSLSARVVAVARVAEATLPAACAAGAEGAALAGARGGAGAVAAAAAFASCSEGRADHFYQLLDLHRCTDERSLRESCKALLYAPEGAASDLQVLQALQVLFSSYNITAALLSDCIKKLEDVIERDTIDKQLIGEVIKQTESIRLRKEFTGKEARKLNRDVLILLGKYGHMALNVEVANAIDSIDMVKLKNELKLPIDGIKIGIHRVLQLAIQYEDANAINVLIHVFSSNLNRNWEREEWGRVCAAGARAALRRGEAPVVAPPVALLQYISRERSGGARAALCGALAAQLRPGVDNESLRIAADRAALLLRQDDVTTRRAGLDLTRVILTALNDSTKMLIEFLPTLLVNITYTDEKDANIAFDEASKIFIDKIVVIDEKTIEKIVMDILKNVFDKDKDFFKRSIEITIDFVKCLLVKSNNLVDKVKSYLSSVTEVFKVQYLCAQLKKVGVELRPDVGVHVVYDDFELEAVLSYMNVYSDVMLEEHFEESNKIIEGIVENIPPKCVVNLAEIFIVCLNIYKGNENLQDKFNAWYLKLPIEDITHSIKLSECKYKTEIEALKIMSKIFTINQKLDWAQILIGNEHNRQMALQCSVLEVALNSSREALKEIIVNKPFCIRFMDVVCTFLVEKPYLYDELAGNCSLLVDAARSFATIDCSDGQVDNLLELVDMLWPVYEKSSNFKEKYMLLYNISQLRKSLSAGSKPLRWATETLKEGHISVEDKTKLIGVLPGGKEFRQSYHDYALCLPTRIRDATPEVLRPLLDIISDTKDRDTKDMLTDILMKWADDESEGWWEEAVRTRMAGAGSSPGAALAALARSRHPLALCRRVLLPLLRHSTASACEDFFCNTIEELLGKLKKKNSSCKSIVEQTVALTVLQVAFEKIDTASLKSPTSKLYSKIALPNDNRTGTPRSWYLVWMVCRLCVELRTVPCPDDSAESKKAYRFFTCANLECLAAALCKRRHELQHMYNCLFDVREWKKLFGDGEHDLPIRPQWNRRSKTHAVSLVNPKRETADSSRTRTRSVFLRTLSDNPLHYDLLLDNVQEIETQELDLEDSDLNSHPVASTLTALFQHMSTFSPEWLRKVVAILECDSNHVQWMASQIIWNTRSELQPHASMLRPVLLSVVADWCTSNPSNRVLNGLHFDILEAIIQWDARSSLSDAETEQLNNILLSLIETAITNRYNKYICDYVLDVLNRFLGLFSDKVTIHRRVFDKYLSVGDEETKIKCLKILSILSKKLVYVNDLLPQLVIKLKDRINILELSKLFGAAVNACKDDAVKCDALSSFRAVVWRLRNEYNDYIKMLYYAQKECNECCDEDHFRHVTSLVSLTSGDQKAKCLYILSSHMSTLRLPAGHVDEMFDVIDIAELVSDKQTYEALTLMRDGMQLHGNRPPLVLAAAEYARSPDVKIRKTVCEVMIKAAQCENEGSGNRSKRRKLDFPIENPLAYVGQASVDCDVDISVMAKSWLAKMASTELSNRFADCFRFTIHLPATLAAPTLTMRNVVAFLDIFFDHKKVVEAFKRITEDVSRTVLEPSLAVRTLLNSRGTLTTLTESAIKPKTKKPKVLNAKQTDSGDLLDVLMELYKNYPEVSRTLFIELLKALLNKANDEFDLMKYLLELMPELLGREMGDVTPLVVEMCWLMAMRGGRVEGFEDLIRPLLDASVGSESEPLLRLARDEGRLGDGSVFRYQAISSVNVNDTNYDLKETSFSLKDLTSTFKRMSNWDKLTGGQVRCARRELSVPLWTSRFGDHLPQYRGYCNTGYGICDEYENTERKPVCILMYALSERCTWFDVMASHALGENNINRVNLLAETDKWPRRCFDMSAATEVTLWQDITDLDNIKLPTYIREEDCLAEWAGRLMVRREYLRRKYELDGYLSRSHELAWCARANEMGLWRDVDACVKGNMNDLTENEILAWSVQHLLAKKSSVEELGGLTLTDILQRAGSVLKDHSAASAPGAVIAVNGLMLTLNIQLKAFDQTKLRSIAEQIDIQTSRLNGNVSKTNRDALLSVHQTMIVHYDDICDRHGTEDSVVSDMIDALSKLAELSKQHGDMYLALVLGRLTESPAEELFTTFLDKISILLPTLDTFTIEMLTEVIPAHVIEECRVLKQMLESAKESEKYKRQLELIADAGFVLKSYCGVMLKALSDKDEVAYKETIRRIKEKIYNNDFAGIDYRPLLKYKEDLYSIEDYQQTEEFKNRAERILGQVCRSENRTTEVLVLSQLCPALSRVLERDRCLDSLLALPDGVSAHSFDERVVVFQSLRRPCAVRVRLSDGSARRFVLKRGEPLLADAAAQRLRAHALLLAAAPAPCYHVTPLSEDSGLIEYLEDHETISELVYSTYPQAIELFQSARCEDDRELVLAPAAALQSFQELCARMPPHVLRDALVNRSACVEDYIQKKRNFQESVCAMTLLSWILGLSDRHLDNVMVSARAGGARHVDWETALAADLLPARLTRNIAALCDLAVVESKLQKMLKKLRDSAKVLVSLVTLCFRWKGAECNDMLPLIKGLVSGELLPHQVTSQVMRNSKKQDSEVYIQLLARIFKECKQSGPYSVEEQIQCLFTQCCHPDILSVTRRQWEPWV